MKKLLGLLGAIGLVSTGASTVVSCGTKDNPEVKDIELTDKGSKDITVSTETTVITISNIDKVQDVVAKAADGAVVAVAVNNAEITLTASGKTKTAEKIDITFSDKEAKTLKDGEATTAKTFTLNVTSTYEKTAEKLDLSKEVTVKDFKDLDDDADATILAALIKENKSVAKLTADDVTITVDKKAKTAKIAAKDTSKGFTGSVDVTFTVKAA